MALFRLIQSKDITSSARPSILSIILYSIYHDFKIEEEKELKKLEKQTKKEPAKPIPTKEKLRKLTFKEKKGDGASGKRNKRF